MRRYSLASFLLLASLPAFAAPQMDRRDYSRFDKYYYRQQQGQMKAEIEYSQQAFADIVAKLRELAGTIDYGNIYYQTQRSPHHISSVEEAKKLAPAKLEQINAIERDMGKIIGERAFLPPVKCVVDCAGPEAVSKKIQSLYSAIGTTEWHYYSYDELSTLQAQAEGLQKLSYLEPVKRASTLLETCSQLKDVSREFESMHIFTHQSVYLRGSEFKLVNKNKVVFRADINLGDAQVQGVCVRGDDGNVHVQAEGFELEAVPGETTDGVVRLKSGWRGTYNGEALR